jgi:NADH-quinone oxidoreductase subunit N
MLAALMAATDWVDPVIDYHALAPEIVLAGVLVAVIIVDLFLDERSKWATSTLAGIGLLATLLPLATLAVDDGQARVMFDGAYVVDDFSLVVKALFCIAAYVVVLMSSTYIEEGDYYQGEYYTLLLTSTLGMLMMASSRELVSMFVALEFLSIPAYMLAAWRKRDPKSNEAGMKYFLLGVFASAVMLYGMSLLYGASGTTMFTGISAHVTAAGGDTPIIVVGVVFIIVGFAFKVSAVPFHTWAPDTYEGAPTPVTAFLSVASKAAGFVAMLQLLFIAFPDADEVTKPFFWVVAALTMTVGNLVALKQTNIVRMLAYSSVAQGGFILMPLAVMSDNLETREDALTAVVTYLLVYAAMNLGAFSVVLAVARKTRSGEISSYGGLFTYAPGLTLAMTLFLFSLGGIPPLGGWVAKFAVFRSLLSDGGGWATALAVIGAVNSVIALYYYANIARQMWFNPPPDGDTTAVKVPAPLFASLAITSVATLVIGVLPNLVLRFGDLSSIVANSGG